VFQARYKINPSPFLSLLRRGKIGIGIGIGFGMLHLLVIGSFLADTKIAKILVSAEIKVSDIYLT
jgi:hypothetical protein